MLAAGIVTFFSGRSETATPARAQNVYGLVTVSDGRNARSMEAVGALRPDEWLQTHSGSEAAVMLADGSRIAVRPRSRLQVQETRSGAKVLLQAGSVGIEASGQPKGKTLRIETPVARVEVVGTRLDVRLVEKPDGTNETRVVVSSGEVKLESDEKAVVIWPNDEGIAAEGKPPVRRSLTDEVNEMVRLIQREKELAERSGVPAGRPMILDFNVDGTATVWTVVSIRNGSAESEQKYSLHSGRAISAAEAFTLEGAPVSVTAGSGDLHFDFSARPLKAGETTELIAKLSGVGGLFDAKGPASFEFSSPASGSPGLSLLQFRLPEGARIEEVFPPPIETRRAMSRTIVTLAGNAALPDLFGQGQ
jgi:hypothetical protein